MPVSGAAASGELATAPPMRDDAGQSTAADLSRWPLRDASDHIFVFPNCTISPGHAVRVWTVGFSGLLLAAIISEARGAASERSGSRVSLLSAASPQAFEAGLRAHPLLGSAPSEARSRGMRQALPYVDTFAPGHNLASLEALVRDLR